MVVCRRQYIVYDLTVWQHGTSRKLDEYEFLGCYGLVSLCFSAMLAWDTTNRRWQHGDEPDVGLTSVAVENDCRQL